MKRKVENEGYLAGPVPPYILEKLGPLARQPLLPMWDPHQPTPSFSTPISQFHVYPPGTPRTHNGASYIISQEKDFYQVSIYPEVTQIKV